MPGGRSAVTPLGPRSRRPTIREHHAAIGHYHTAGVPGRHELDENQELHYPAIVRAIRDTGYQGFLGQELIPTAADPLASLEQAVRVCDV